MTFAKIREGEEAYYSYGESYDRKIEPEDYEMRSHLIYFYKFQII